MTAKLDKILQTFQYRIKDSNEKLVKSLYEKSGSVNFVWNYCNHIQQEAVNRHRKWLSGFDLNNLTSGSSKELNLMAETVQSICEEYAKKRIQFNKPYLKFRTNKKNRNLPWIPFKQDTVKHIGKGTFTYNGLKLKTWYSRDLPKNSKITNGTITCDNTGKWFINLTFQLIFNSIKEQENYQLSLTSKGQNLSAIDPGLNPMLTLSIEEPDGKVRYEAIEPNKYYAKEQESLGKAQRANKKNLSKNINKKIKNKRKDFNNKLALELVMNNHTIVNSDISYKSIMKSKLKGHAKAWSDNSLGNLRLTLKFKAKKHSVKYAEVNERILVSTETCSVCRQRTGPKGRKGLSVSAWQCSNAKCGRHHNRNENSADNHRLAYKESLLKAS